MSYHFYNSKGKLQRSNVLPDGAKLAAREDLLKLYPVLFINDKAQEVTELTVFASDGVTVIAPVPYEHMDEQEKAEHDRVVAEHDRVSKGRKLQGAQA